MRGGHAAGGGARALPAAAARPARPRRRRRRPRPPAARAGGDRRRRSSRGRPGLAFFDAHALRHVHGDLRDVVTVARRAAGQPGARRRRADALRRPRRRLARPAAHAPRSSPARARATSRRCPSRCCARSPRAARRTPAWPRCPSRSSGSASPRSASSAKLPRAAIADRFGAPGLRARDLARGRDVALRTRVPVERLQEELELPESASGPQLEQGLGLLIDRLLARPERRGRALRSAVLSRRARRGRDVAGADGLPRAARRPQADAPRARRQARAACPRRPRSCACAPRASARRGGAQGALLTEPATARSERLREAIRQARAAAGPEAALRVLAVDPDSRVPERRLTLAPWETGVRARSTPRSPARVRVRRPGGRPLASRRPRRRRRPRVVADRGPLVDGRAAPPPLLGGRDRRRPQRRRLPRPRVRRLVQRTEGLNRLEGPARPSSLDLRSTPRALDRVIRCYVPQSVPGSL